MNHSQARDLLPGYALGALEVREQEELELHLRSCDACYQLAQEQVEVAAYLATGIAEVEPPAGLKAQIEDSVAEESKPLESRLARAPGPSFLERLGLTSRGPAFAVSAAAGIVVIMMGVVLAYVLISVGDIDDLRDDNATLTAKLDAQGAAAAAAGATLAQLELSSLALASTLDQQTSALALAQSSLDSVQQTSSSLPPTLEEQSQALAAAQLALSDLQADNLELAAQFGQQVAGLAASQQDLDRLRRDNQDLTARISDQDAVLAASQGDIEDLRAENATQSATLTDQQIFTYLQALPVSAKYVLKATENAPGTFGLLMTNVGQNWGVAALLGVEPLEPGMVYELWLEKDGVAIKGWFIKHVDPVTKFGQVYAQNFPIPVNEFDRIFVTLEPLGGSPAPTGPMLLLATIN